MTSNRNVDPAVVDGFGDEWTRFDQRALGEAELQTRFDEYFRIFPWDTLPASASGFDLGCGSGRWARHVAPRVGELHCIDASESALNVARAALADQHNVRFHHASVDEIPLADGSADFGYSLGVLHHVPDTLAGLRSCVAKLKKNAPFLVYLYYRFDNRPFWFAALWRVSDVFRRAISVLPLRIRSVVCQAIAFCVYWPLARLAAVVERFGVRVEAFPLSYYRKHSFYTMRTDALDRFGTRLERRFTKAEIQDMMERAGLEDVRFSSSAPYWCAVGRRA
jgi:ubiquinone/menaquinone biosynthesis C-methylase UbiE